ncbi:FAR1-related sequence 5-like protein [Tanacetum coccineum]
MLHTSHIKNTAGKVDLSREGFLSQKKQGENQQGKNHQGENQQGENQQGENGDNKKKQKRNKPSSRCGGEDKICLYLTRVKKYVLYIFEEKHNHSLVHPDDRHYLKSSQKLNYSDKTLLVKMSNRNIGPVVAYNILAEIHGGFDKVGALPQDAKNFKRDILACTGDNDANMIVKMLTKKKECVSDFSFEYRLANENVTLRGGVGKRILFPIESFDRPYQSTGFSGEVPGAVFVDVVQKEMLAAVHACYSIRVVSLDESRQYTILDTNVRVNFFNDNGDKIIGGHNSIELEYQRYIERRWTRDYVPMKSFEAITIRHGLDFPEIDEDDDTILPCQPANTKGSGRKRLKNAYEEASTKKQRQTRYCTKCGARGHNLQPWRKFVDVARDIELIMLNVSRNWFMGQFVECLIKCPISTALLVVPGIHAPDFDKTQ